MTWFCSLDALMSERVDMYRRAVRVPFSKPGDAFAEVASSFVFGVGGHLDGYLWSSIADDGAQVLGKLAECIVAALQHAWLARVQAQSLRISKRTLKPWMKTSLALVGPSGCARRRRCQSAAAFPARMPLCSWRWGRGGMSMLTSHVLV